VGLKIIPIRPANVDRWRLNRFYRFCGLDLGEGVDFLAGSYYRKITQSKHTSKHQTDMVFDLISNKTYSLDLKFPYRF
jgi:hypothetical protein